jgi:hypothetical protein
LALAAQELALSHGVQAMRISFADSSVLDEVLKHGTDLKISFGKSMVRDLPSWAVKVLVQIEIYR